MLLVPVTHPLAARASASAPRPHVVIILVDDMGYGDPGCFNAQSKIPTPHIDSLARDGMRFTDAHAPGPLCHMSRYGLMTGCYPFRTNVALWPRQPLIQPGQMTIASLAQSQGYHTAMVGKWHLGFREQGYDQPLPGGPVDCGFDWYFGIRASTDIPPYFYIRNDRALQPPTAQIEANRSDGWSPIQGAFWRAGGIAPGLQLKDVLPRFTDEAVTVIQQHAQQQPGQPLMLYLAYPAPHTPWLPAEEFAGRSGAGMYGDFLMMVDVQIGRVLDALQRTKMADNTLLVFTSDNGPVWYADDTQRLGHDSTGGLRGMKADAWEAGHRMPLVVRWPGRVAAASRSDQLVCFTDLLATLAEILDVPLPPEAGADSFSFLPALTGQQPFATPLRSHFVMRAGSVASMMTIRSGPWKLITGLGSGGFTKPNRLAPGPDDPSGQLYNLADDLGELTNLYLQQPQRVAQLTAQLQDIVSSGRSYPAAARRSQAEPASTPASSAQSDQRELNFCCAGSPQLERSATATLTAVELDCGETLRFTLADGQPRTLQLEETWARVLLTNLPDTQQGHYGGGTHRVSIAPGPADTAVPSWSREIPTWPTGSCDFNRTWQRASTNCRCRKRRHHAPRTRSTRQSATPSACAMPRESRRFG